MKEVRPPKRPLIFYYCVAMLILLLFNFLAMPWMARQQIQEVDYGTFMDMAENQDLGQVEIQEQENQIVFTNKDETAVYSTGMIPDPDLKQMLKDSGAEFSGQVIQQTDPILSFLLTWILPIVIFVALGQYLSRRMMKNMGGPNAMAFGKSNAKVYVKSSEGIKFSDVAGEDEAKDNLKEIVEYLHDPKKYQEIGATMPKGILLVGPPGTGKTMLAKAVAGEANVPFFSISGSDFVEMFVGMGASKVRDLFKQAKEKAPCIVFIDEIDAIGQKRNSGAYGGNDEREQTLNQLLTEMDGFEGNTGVIILAATNRDLRAEVAAGRFRQDLYYRLSAFSVELPPLRSCPEDVCFLIDRLMEKIPQKYGVPPRSLSGEAFGKLLAYNWPGNIRELENVLENAVALSESELIYAEHIHLEGTAPAPLTLKERLKREERQILRQTLAQCGGSRVKAMELLGLSKTVFYGKLKGYQLD